MRASTWWFLCLCVSVCALRRWRELERANSCSQCLEGSHQTHTHTIWNLIGFLDKILSVDMSIFVVDSTLVSLHADFYWHISVFRSIAMLNRKTTLNERIEFTVKRRTPPQIHQHNYVYRIGCHQIEHVLLFVFVFRVLNRRSIKPNKEVKRSMTLWKRSGHIATTQLNRKPRDSTQQTHITHTHTCTMLMSDSTRDLHMGQ